jgi:hypothetical protein
MSLLFWYVGTMVGRVTTDTAKCGGGWSIDVVERAATAIKPLPTATAVAIIAASSCIPPPLVTWKFLPTRQRHANVAPAESGMACFDFVEIDYKAAQ